MARSIPEKIVRGIVRAAYKFYLWGFHQMNVIIRDAAENEKAKETRKTNTSLSPEQRSRKRTKGKRAGGSLSPTGNPPLDKNR